MMSFIEEQAASFPELRAAFEELGSLYEKKLWHQLTVALDDFLRENRVKLGSDVAELMYTKFISNFEARLNQVRLVMLVSTIGHSFNEPTKSIELFESVLKSRTRLGVEASLCLDMDITIINVKIGNLDAVKVALEDAKDKVTSFSSAETVPFSKYFKACALYRKVRTLAFSKTICSSEMKLPHHQRKNTNTNYPLLKNFPPALDSFRA